MGIRSSLLAAIGIEEVLTIVIGVRITQWHRCADVSRTDILNGDGAVGGINRDDIGGIAVFILSGVGHLAIGFQIRIVIGGIDSLDSR